jgi:hypothetical protein
MVFNRFERFTVFKPPALLEVSDLRTHATFCAAFPGSESRKSFTGHFPSTVL